MVSTVERSDVEPAVERDALATFELLGEAKAGVHGESLEESRFHEVRTLPCLGHERATFSYCPRR